MIGPAGLVTARGRNASGEESAEERLGELADLGAVGPCAGRRRLERGVASSRCSAAVAPQLDQLDSVSGWGQAALDRVLQPWLHNPVSESPSTPPRPGEWLLLSYRLPREPSGPRTTLWRRLKRLGVAQLSDGLVALPADSRTREALEWLADEVLAADGAAGLWVARPATAAQERELAAGMAAARAAEYRELTDACAVARAADPAERVRALRRLRGEWRAINRRDFFPPAEREATAGALHDLAAALAGDTARAAGEPEMAR